MYELLFMLGGFVVGWSALSILIFFRETSADEAR